MSENSNPVFRSVVLLVNDIKKSKYFYNVLLGQKIVMDFGKNINFEGGLAIWEKRYALNLIFNKKENNINLDYNETEIYFESSDLESLYKRLMNADIKFIHPIIEQPWGQRVFRLYDPDNYIIEFAESMENVVLRLFRQGYPIEEISKKSEMPLDFINNAIRK